MYCWFFRIRKNKQQASLYRFKDFKIKELDFYKLLSVSNSWVNEIKAILEHKDCPIDILKKYAVNEHFFVRMVAIFSPVHREAMIDFAKKDKDSRVRSLYYKYLILNTEMDIEGIRGLLKKESKQTIELVKQLVLEEQIVNW